MIKVVHIGIGHDHSGVTLETMRKYPHLFDVVGVVEPDKKLRETIGKQDAYNGLPWLTLEEAFAIEDLDAAVVESCEHDLVPYSQLCIDRGLHVHMDKPGGEDIVAYEKLLKSAKDKRLCLQLGYMYRYNHAFLKCMDEIKKGTLGDIFEVDTMMSIEHTAEKRKWLENFKGGMMFFLGCHMIDLILMIQGIPNDIISFNRSTGFDGNINSRDNTLAVFEYDRGVSTVRVTANEINGYSRRHLVVCGEKGTIEIRPLEFPTEMTIAIAEDSKGRQAFNCKKPWVDFDPIGRYDDMMTEFEKYVTGKKENPYTYEYELTLQKVVLKACGFDIDYKN